jgi:hypothetical protein
MVQALSMDMSYKYNSMQTLVHRDCPQAFSAVVVPVVQVQDM